MAASFHVERDCTQQSATKSARFRSRKTKDHSMTQATDTKHHSRKPFAALLALGLAALAALAIVLSSGGGGSGRAANYRAASGRPPGALTSGPAHVRAARKVSLKAARKPPAPKPASHPAATTPTAPAPAAPAAHVDQGIPQHNGGDMDPDNNAGPNDGDGDI